MSPIDLHTHSTKSDGTFSPEELIRYAQAKGLFAVALTDHDTADGIEEALLTARKLREEVNKLSGSSSPIVPEVIPGVELSTEYRGRDIHVVGLFIDWKNCGFISKLREFADARIYRNQKMCRLLTEGGYPVNYEELQSSFPDTVITRAHFAQYMLEKGYISSIDEAFRKLIGDDCPFFVPRLSSAVRGCPGSGPPASIQDERRSVMRTARLSQRIRPFGDRGLLLRL